MKIVVESIVKTKVIYMEEKEKHIIIISIRKKVVECVYDMAGKNNFWIQFEDGQRKEMSTFLLTLISDEDEFVQWLEDTILEPPTQKWMWIIDY